MDQTNLDRALARLTTGIYVLTVSSGQTSHGMSSSWVTQVSGSPPLLALAVDVTHRTHAVLAASGRFVLNVVGRKSKHLEDYFYSPAARADDNLRPIPHHVGPNGGPVLDEALAWLGCRVLAQHPAGDHTLFVAEVEAADVVAADDEPISSADLPYVYVGKLVPRR
jgi:flavin reductase (DIM6/NTAB) family NADH-FMN oxidoreductase RutF